MHKTRRQKLNADIIAWVRDISVFLAVWLVFTTAGWGFYYIPSGSMEPTLEVGDRLAVSKFSYGYNKYSVFFYPSNLPENRLFESAPTRGDIAVFTMPKRGNEDIIKRVIGLPGDRVQTREGRLYINGTLVKRSFVRDVVYTDYNGINHAVKEYDEILPGGIVHRIYEHSDTSRYDNAGPFIVPKNHYFMMGDNRDNSTDSRELSGKGIGYVPIAHFVGRADITTFSTYDCDQGKDIFCPAGLPLGRFFAALH